MKPSKEFPTSPDKPSTPAVDQTPPATTTPATLDTTHGITHGLTIPTEGKNVPARAHDPLTSPVVAPAPPVVPPAVSPLTSRHNVTVPPPSELTLKYGPKQPTRNVTGQAYPKVVYRPRVGSVPVVDDTQTVASLAEEKTALGEGWKLTPSPVPVELPIQPLSAEELRVLVHLIERLKPGAKQAAPGSHATPVSAYPKTLYRRRAGHADDTLSVVSAEDEYKATQDGWTLTPSKKG